MKKEPMVQLIVPQVKDTSKLATAKVAETFNTNRTYIDEATRLKWEDPEAFEDVKRENN